MTRCFAEFDETAVFLRTVNQNRFCDLLFKKVQNGVKGFHESVFKFSSVNNFVHNWNLYKAEDLEYCFWNWCKKMEAISECILCHFRNAFHMQDLQVVCCVYLNFWKLNNTTWRMFKSTVMRKSAKVFNISGWPFSSLIAKSKVPIHTSYLPH